MTPQAIAVVGLWHLGSVVAASWSELGHSVVGVDTDEGTVRGLQQGRAPVYEPGLDDVLRKHVATGRLRFTTSPAAVSSADVVFLAFDTPVDADDRPDLAPLEAAVRAFTPHLAAGATVVVSSQVPVGTSERWRDQIRREASNPGVDLVYSPENLRLGEALACYTHPDRIVVGVNDDATRDKVAQLFGRIDAPIVWMSVASGEMAKHALNAFLATSVSFINEVATLCEVAGADVLSVVQALKTDARIGPRAFLNAGFGFAGGTLARDVQVLRDLGASCRRTTPLLEGVLEVNASRPVLLLNWLQELYADVRDLSVGVLGLTYKAGTSTLRRSVALDVIGSLRRAGVHVRAYDPKADLSEVNGPIDFDVVGDAYEAARGASALAILTEWPEFVALDFERVRSAMARPVVFDGKNLLADLELADRGFVYRGIGR